MKSYSCALLALLVLSCVGSSLGNCTCACYPVTTTQDTLEEVMYTDKLYLQAVSANSILAGIDSACFLVGESDASCAIFLEIIFTSSDYFSYVEPAVMTTAKPGVLLKASILLYEYDYVLGQPCEGVFVLYRCIKASYPYAGGECLNDVLIISGDQYVAQSCIDDGISIAQENFPCLDFVYLPNTVPYPCCTSPQIPLY